MKRIIFNISGGMGKNIMATAVVKNIKNHYPDHEIIITTPYEEIWRHNPNVTEIINIEKKPYFFRDYLNDPESILLRFDPYHTEDFAYQRKHLNEIWSDLSGIPYDKNILPELFFTEAEMNDAKRLIGEKPAFFIQTSGGAPNQQFPISWTRDLPLASAQKIADKMKKEGYEVFHVRRANQPALTDVRTLTRPIREVLAALSLSKKRLLIDSILQHAAAALQKPSVVVWIGNKPEVFGYEMHSNILPTGKKEFRHMIDSYLDRYNITGTLEEAPYNTNEIFNDDEILKALLPEV